MFEKSVETISVFDCIYIRDSQLNRPESVSLANNWSSEASPTLGSIEISRDIYI